MWGGKGNDEGEYAHQHAITVDFKDYVYLTDGREKSRISVIDSNGNFLSMWGPLGCKDDQFLIPYDIAMDSEFTCM